MLQPEDDELSMRQQCALLHVARSGLYYEPVEVDAEDLELMRRRYVFQGRGFIPPSPRCMGV